MRNRPPAVVLLSGGLDSATTLFLAKKQGFRSSCLIFDYGQRHCREIEYAKKLAQRAGCGWEVLKIEFPWKGSSLLDKNLIIPRRSDATTGRPADGKTGRRADAIPSTYVPGRNIIFLSFALSYAEAIKAGTIFIGAHAQDYSGYPDCRPEFYRVFAQVIATGTKSGVQKRKIKIKTPLIHKTKAEIIKLGLAVGVPFALTWSCYQGGKRPCGKCDSCYFRAKGFKEAGLTDPLLI